MNERAIPVGAKRRDYWWTVLFVDPLALPIVRALTNVRRPTPDQISIFAILLGLAVGPVFALGTRASLVAGGLLFYLAFFVDCIDGKLARALAVTSQRGAALDRIGDGGRRAGASLGLTIGVWRNETFAEDAFLFVVVYAFAAYYFFELSGAETPIEKTTRDVDESSPPAGVTGRWSAALARRRLLPTPGMPDVQAIVFIIGPLTGHVLTACVVGTAMVTAGMLISVWRRVR